MNKHSAPWSSIPVFTQPGLSTGGVSKIIQNQPCVSQHIRNAGKQNSCLPVGISAKNQLRKKNVIYYQGLWEPSSQKSKGINEGIHFHNFHLQFFHYACNDFPHPTMDQHYEHAVLKAWLLLELKEHLPHVAALLGF